MVRRPLGSGYDDGVKNTPPSEKNQAERNGKIKGDGIVNVNTRSFVLALGMALFCLVAVTASPAHSATITVTANAPDVLNGANASCALREAIQNMNDAADTYADCAKTGAAYGTSDTINLPAGTYTNAIAGVGEDLNATGDLDILANVTITGAGAGSSIIDGGAIDRVIHVGAGRTVSFSGVTIRNGSIGDNGGGIASAGTVTITNSTISGNTISGFTRGGGLYITGGVLNITNSTFSGNNADFVFGMGAAIYLDASAATITNSTISGNTGLLAGITTQGGGALAFTGSTLSGNTGNAYIFVVGVGGTGTITNSTIANNTVAGAVNGVIRAGGNITIKNTTVYGNQPYGLHAGAGTITLSNNIISGNTTADCLGGGSITSSGHNLASDNSCNLVGAGDIPNSVLANLDALASNGGSTQTMALLAGSAAINAGDCSAGAVTTDQRGTARPQGPACDIGAYEFNYYTLSTTVTGSGTVTSDTAGTNCPGTCAESLANGTSVTLTAAVAAGYTFTGWGGTCAGSAATCNVTVNAVTNVTATFTVIPPGAVPGCTDSRATNYNPAATVDNGSCAYPQPDFGQASSLDFGTGKVNTSVQKTITIRNTGPGTTYIYSLDISGSPFSIVSDSCSGKAIGRDGACDIVVSFNPSSAGPFTGTLKVWTSAGKYNPLSVSLSGKATVSSVSSATLISPADGATLTGTKVTFDWTAGSDATGAKITDSAYVCEQSDFKGCETPVLTSRETAIPTAGLVILLGLAAPFGLRNRRVRSVLLALIFMTAGGAALWACGGGSSSNVEKSGKTLTLKAGTKYYWKVATASANGTEESEVRSFTTGK